MRKNKKGFTLIELIAVIVILGVLMIIAIPTVTRYIDNSKKEAFIKEINSLVDTVRYGINSGDSNYLNEKTFDLTKIELEKGKNTIESGILTVEKIDNTYQYSIKVTKENNDYCLVFSNISNITIETIISCSDMGNIQYRVGDRVTFADTDWIVIKQSTYSDDYVVLLKENILMNLELGSYAPTDGSNGLPFYYSETCHAASYGEEHYDTSGCQNTNNYQGSYIKKFLENEYLPKLEKYGNLEFVRVYDQQLDGLSRDYKIRLLTTSEVRCSDVKFCNFDNKPDDWLFSSTYWTMRSSSSADSSNLDYVNYVSSYDKAFKYYGKTYDIYGVRPVINLKKSSISNN